MYCCSISRREEATSAGVKEVNGEILSKYFSFATKGDKKGKVKIATVWNQKIFPGQDGAGGARPAAEPARPPTEVLNSTHRFYT